MADEELSTASSTIKSGWRTTEAYAVYMTLGILGYTLQELIKLIPAIAENPSLPGWLSPILMIAPVGLAWVMKRVNNEYLAKRTELKIAVTNASVTSAAVEAGAAAAKADEKTTLEALNK